MESNKSAFQFDNFKIVRSIFERKMEVEISRDYVIGFAPKAKFIKEKNKFELFLGLRIEDTNKNLCIIVDTIAEYTLKGENSEKEILNYFYINAPAILFPYIRAYISALTTLSGYLNPIILPTLNLVTLADDIKKNTEFI